MSGKKALVTVNGRIYLLFYFFSFSGGLQSIQVMTERIQVYTYVFIKPFI